MGPFGDEEFRARLDRRQAAHVAEPKPDTAYTMTGPRAGRLIDYRFTRSFPAEGICAGCGEMIRRETQADGWVHTGRMPGEPLG